MRATAPKGKRTIVVDVRPEDWIRAEEQWALLKQSVGSLGYQSLRDFQYNLWAKAKSSPKSVVGEPILVITDTNGTMFNNHPYPATVLKTFEAEGHLLFRVIYHPIEEETWKGERIEDIRLYQVMPLRTPKAATQTERESVQLALLLTKLNASRNSELTSLRLKQNSILNSIAGSQKDLAKYEKNLREVERKMKGQEGDFLTQESLKDMLEELAKHSKIAWAMITKAGELVFETTMLHMVERKTGKEHRDVELGRFAVYASANNATPIIYAENLDYSVDGYGAPNLNGQTICMGENITDIQDLVRAGKFYDFADFMIGFFSIHPHDGGDGGYISSDDWLERRDEEAFSIDNPWAHLDSLYTVHQKKGITNRKLRKRGDNLLARASKTIKKALPNPTKVEKAKEKLPMYEDCEDCGVSDSTVQSQYCETHEQDEILC